MADTTKKTAEAWAFEAGLLPQVTERPAEGKRPARTVHNADFWKFAATRAGEGWPVGAELTKGDFDAAVKRWTQDARFGARDVGPVAEKAETKAADADGIVVEAPETDNDSNAPAAPAA